MNLTKAEEGKEYIIQRIDTDKHLFHYLYNEKIPILLLYAISHVRS